MNRYTKLRDGTWGVRGPEGDITTGERVEVTKRGGEIKTETIDRVIWRGNGLAIATLAKTRKKVRQASVGECRDCGCTESTCVRNGRCAGGPSFDPCHDCR